MGELFEKADFGNSDGNIDNLLDPFDGWRIPTKAEWESLAGTTRAGSTVNGTSGRHWAVVQISDVEYAEYAAVGILFFPDGASITGSSLTLFDGDHSKNENLECDDVTNYGFSNSELNEYLSQGCAFLPSGGRFNSNIWYSNEEDFELTYATSTESSSNKTYNFFCNMPGIRFDSNSSKSGASGVSYTPVRLVKSTE